MYGRQYNFSAWFKNIFGISHSWRGFRFCLFYMINFLKQKPLSRAERRRQRRLNKQVKLPKNWGIMKTK
jgi:hypothetical protein